MKMNHAMIAKKQGAEMAAYAGSATALVTSLSVADNDKTVQGGGLPSPLLLLSSTLAEEGIPFSCFFFF